MIDKYEIGTEGYLYQLTSRIITRISNVQSTYVEISRLFCIINEKGLYKIKYKTFQEYINQNFKINYQTVCKMINVFKYFLNQRTKIISNSISFDRNKCPYFSNDFNNTFICNKSNERCTVLTKNNSCYMISNFNYTKFVPFLSLIKDNKIDDSLNEEIYQQSFFKSKSEMEKWAKEIKNGYSVDVLNANEDFPVLDINKERIINILKESIKNILYNYLITLQYVKFHPDFPNENEVIAKILGNYCERNGISFFIPDWKIKKPKKKKKVNSDYKLISDCSNLYYKNKKMRGGIPNEFYDSDYKNLHFILLKNEILYILSKPNISELDNSLNFSINKYIEKRLLNINFLDTSDNNYTATILNEQNLAIFNITYFYFNLSLYNERMVNIYFDKLCLKEYNYNKKKIYDTFCSENFKDYLS